MRRGKADALLQGASFQLSSYEQALCLSHSLFLPQTAWVTVRFVLAGYALAIVIWSLTDSNRYYATFLTYWMLVTETVYLWVAAAASAVMARMPKPQPYPRPNLRRRADWMVSPLIDDLLTVKWVLRSIVAPGTLLVAVGFWTAVHAGGGGGDALNIHIHGVNFAIMLVDLTFSSAPVHLMHFWTLFVYGTAYVAFTVSYFFSTNDRVYVPLDYSRPGVVTAVILIAILVVVPAATLVIWCYYLLRNTVAYRVFGIERAHRPPFVTYTLTRRRRGEAKEGAEEKEQTVPTSDVLGELTRTEPWRVPRDAIISIAPPVVAIPA